MALHRYDEPLVAMAERKPSLYVFDFDKDYVRKHGHAPEGVQCWQFRVGPSGHFPEGELVGVGEPMEYAAAVALAKQYAVSLWRQRGDFSHVYVVP